MHVSIVFIFLFLNSASCYSQSLGTHFKHYQTSRPDIHYHRYWPWTHSTTQSSPWIIKNKNMLTGPANCKKTTRHHAHLSLCAKSRKTNNAKSRKWPKTSIWAIFWRFRGQISRNPNFFWKIGFISNWRSYLVLTSGQTKKIVWAVFEKNISVWFWANFETFSQISPNQDFSFKKPADFYTFIVP